MLINNKPLIPLYKTGAEMKHLVPSGSSQFRDLTFPPVFMLKHIQGLKYHPGNHRAPLTFLFLFYPYHGSTQMSVATQGQARRNEMAKFCSRYA